MEVNISLSIANPATPPSPSVKIPMEYQSFIKLFNHSQTFELLVDGDIETLAPNDWSVFVNPAMVTYEFRNATNVVIDNLRFYDVTGSFPSPVIVYAVDEYWQRVQLASFTAGGYMEWISFPQSTPVKAKYIYIVGNAEALGTFGQRASEMEVWGSYESNTTPVIVPDSNVLWDTLVGACIFEWFAFDSDHPTEIEYNQAKLAQIGKLGVIRHYLDWRRVEETYGNYTFQPERNGGWFLDDMYQELRDRGVRIICGFQKTPQYIYGSYPSNTTNREDIVPCIYPKRFDDPASYIEMGKFAFQFAARYGNNTNVNPALVKVDTSQPNPWDPINEVKIGLGLVEAFECGNEVNKTWVNRDFYQTAREHAANLSMVYDGHKGAYGEDVGIKTADPTMLVATMGTIEVNPDYFMGIIDWSRQHRGYLPNGEVDVPFDIINFHSYRNDANGSQFGNATTGVAPEITDLYDDVIRLREIVAKYFPSKKIQWGETGYDWNQGSVQKAPPIGSKTSLEVFGDWILRSSLEAGRIGLDYITFYELYDDDPTGLSTTQYATSGLVANNYTNRPASAYLAQATSILSGLRYSENISLTPRVDKWSNTTVDVYAIWSPTDTDVTGTYNLSVADAHSLATLYTIGGLLDIPESEVLTPGASYSVDYSETPVFVKIDKS